MKPLTVLGNGLLVIVGLILLALIAMAIASYQDIVRYLNVRRM